MKKLPCYVAAMLIATPTTALAMEGEQTMTNIEVIENGSQSLMRDLAEYFVGDVRVEPLFSPQGAEQASGASVTFEPGARTNWHSHPIGQTLIVISGKGWVQADGQQRQVIETGDVVKIPADTKHWHGATDHSAMTHIAIQEANEDGEVVNWLEAVSKEQYER